MYYLLTSSFQQQEQKLATMIKAAAPVQQLYLLGSSLQQERTESIFVPEAPTRRQVGHYWLLALVGKSNYTCNQLQDQLENQCQAIAPTTLFVVPIQTFAAWLQSGHPFAMRVKERAVLLHGKAAISHSNQLPPMQAEEESDTAERFISLATEFMAGAELYQQRQQYPLAAFMLHQAAENALHAILKSGTGLHMNTHNLDKLVRYCSMLTDKVQQVLPRQRPADERLFKLLQDAYIQARYKQALPIAPTDIALLIKRGQALLELAGGQKMELKM
jgi:HEPN domain-containing protein